MNVLKTRNDCCCCNFASKASNSLLGCCRFELFDVTGVNLMSQIKFEPRRAQKNKGAFANGLCQTQQCMLLICSFEVPFSCSG